MEKITAKIMDLTDGLSQTGRQYDQTALKDAIERFNASGNKSVHISDAIPGELSHPLANMVGRVSGDVKLKADGLWADVELHDAPIENIMQELHNAGASLNFAPRIATKETEKSDSENQETLIKDADIISIDLITL